MRESPAKQATVDLSNFRVGRVHPVGPGPHPHLQAPAQQHPRGHGGRRRSYQSRTPAAAANDSRWRCLRPLSRKSAWRWRNHGANGGREGPGRGFSIICLMQVDTYLFGNSWCRMCGQKPFSCFLVQLCAIPSGFKTNGITA